ncbi:Brp/Blh family beta-carotene 15,15'-dioxygenase [Pelagibacteraceae bacterium]|nr:Brp/Blh family beta-carotene 15,15'-dioxygenase [Pelagibacteraceae bacterium]
MNLYKTNKEHSVILFFITLILLASDYLNFNYQISFLTIICFFLISTIGVTHGALDNLKGYRLLKIYGVKKNYVFYLAYITLSFFTILFWILFPMSTLALFLLVASYHFGKEDSSFGKLKKMKLNGLLFFLKGSIVILAPLIFHTDETLKIFEILGVQLKTTNTNILFSLIALSLLSNFFINNNAKFSLLDWITILILNITFSPLVAFTIYFCFLHSVRHSLSLIYELNKNNFKKGFRDFVKKALPLTMITGILYLFAASLLVNTYSLDDAILKVIFIGLASLTFPHILLEYLLEKNEK